MSTNVQALQTQSQICTKAATLDPSKVLQLVSNSLSQGSPGPSKLKILPCHDLKLLLPRSTFT